jgi:uncharacterized membrane protein
MKLLFALPLAATLTACMAYPPPPPITPNPPGGTYRALGTEPFWSLTIDPQRMVFTEANAPGVEVVQSTPRVIVGFAGEIYQTPRIGVNIVHQQCSDGMSDRVYPDRVQVDVDGRRFNGCGGAAVQPAALAGTNWRVAAVNGRPTPPQGQYFLNFEGDRLGAKFGFNSMGGPYRQDGVTLLAGPIAATRMGCPEPAMSFENQGAAVLGQPMTMSWAGGDRLTLSNSAGRIELQRSY